MESEKIVVPEDIAAMPFEQALSELEKLVGQMESGGMPLSDLMAGYERGRQLTAYCRQQLDGFEKKISILTADDGAKGQWSDFTPDNNR